MSRRIKLRGWLWFARTYGIGEAFFYWQACRRQGVMTSDEFKDFLYDHWEEWGRGPITREEFDAVLAEHYL